MSYNQGTIKNVLFGSTRQSTNILEIFFRFFISGSLLAARNEKSGEYVEGDSDCKIEKDDECKIFDCL